MTAFPRLFEPGKIGKLEVKNRIIFAPMVTRYVTADGGITERMIDYYVERAKGGVGLIVIEAAYPRASGYPGRIYLNDDKFVFGLKRLVEALHRNRAKVIAEVNVHRGRADEFEPASASPVRHPVTGIIPRQLTIEDILKFEQDFGEGIRRVKESGFDGAMIHGGTGYLVAEFLSPLVNLRTDRYGGDLNGRARFLLELVEKARAIAGPDFPIIMRLTADDKLPGGFGPDESVLVCRMLQEHGVDAIDVTAGSQETTEWTFPNSYMPEGSNANLAGRIKKQLHIPVSVAGKINSPREAESILEKNQCDFVDMGRALLADPYLPHKALEGREDDICGCLSCQRCLEIMTMQMLPVKCTVNPAAGREREFAEKLIPTVKRKRILVIGGGPGGMEAAAIAALRGHYVTVWEAGETLGGQLNLACIPPGKSHLRIYNDYLQRQLRTLNVMVVLSKKATATEVKDFAPDAVIVAAGSHPFIPDITGIASGNVVTCREVFSGQKLPGKRVIIIGGGLIGCETADFLSEKGIVVTMVFPEAAPMTLEVVDRSITNVLLKRLADGNVTIIPNVKQFQEITAKGLRLISNRDEEMLFPADTIVLAAGSRPDMDLVESLRGIIPELYEVGDCRQARRILEAVQEGADAALQI